MILFYLAAVINVNECEQKFVECSNVARNAYINVLYNAVTRESIELAETMNLISNLFEFLFGCYIRKQDTI